jgi:predicted Fe-Mo cluster-binding NifX family protein
MQIKLAVPTDDGATISRHFGQAAYFKVVTLEDNQVAFSETRTKASHNHGDHTHSEGDVHPGQAMVDSISDCQVLISGGMGTPVYHRAKAAGLTVILTRISSIDAAVQAYAAGTLEDEPQLVHMH